MKKHIKNLIAYLLIFICAFSVVPAKADENYKTVRIAYGFNDFIKVDENGIVSGHCAAYLAKLADINGWKYEYVKASWSEATRMLESGEIDFLFPTNYTEEREATMDFTSLPIGYTAAGVFALEKRGFKYDNYEAFNGARITYAKGSANEAEFTKYAKEHNITYETVYLDTNDEMMEALRDGRADLAVFSAANEFPDGIIVSVMSAQPVYFTVKKGNVEMLDELNSGMQEIAIHEPDLMTDMFKTAMRGNNANGIALTNDEKFLIESGKEIIVGFYEESEPLSYINADGEYCGVYIEILKHLKEKSGLNLVPYPISRDRNWKELVYSGEIDFYIGASEVIVSADDDMLTTNAFMSYANTLVTKNNSVFNKIEHPVIALTYGRANWANYMKKRMGKDLEIKYYRNSKECLYAVIKGEADASLINNLEFNYQSKNERLSSLVQWAPYRFPTNVGFATSNKIDYVKYSTLNKIIEVLSADYVDMVIEDCLNMSYHSYTFADKVYNSRYTIIIAVVILLFVVFSVIVFYSFRKKQYKIKKASEKMEFHQLQILASTSQEYSAIYYVNLDTDESEAVFCNPEISDMADENSGKTHIYSSAIKKYVNKYVKENYRDSILVFADKEAILEQFKKNKQFSLRYEILPDEREEVYFEMQFFKVDDMLKENNMMVLGVRCIDETVREEREYQQLLQEALDGANRASVAKSDFLSSMSHDIRTPMNAIVGMTAIAEANINNPAKVKDSLKKISKASQHLLGLINDVLDMSKIESGKYNLVSENINLSELIDNLLDIIQQQIKEHNHTLTVDTSGIMHDMVIGDSLRIRQLFLNLMGNAIKYTPDGGKIDFTVREKPVQTTSASCYEFVFADNGIGMTKEVQEHIFDSFTRATDTKINKIQGTGLGLAITKNLVQMMNGDIKVESEPGVGSTFTMTIFLKLQENQDIDMSGFEKIKVLVASDSSEAKSLICEALSELKIVNECCHGEEALEKVKQGNPEGEKYDLIMIDRQIENVSAMGLAEDIKKLDDNMLTDIILLDDNWVEIEEEAKNAGVNGFLSRSATKSEIARLLKKQMSSAGDGSHEESLSSMNDDMLAGRRLLLVEDNMMNREIAREILTMAKLDVEEAENGKEAVDKFFTSHEGYYDMILMDVQMPVMNGYEASKAIRALDHPDAKTIPIVAMTANAFVEDIQAAKDAGMNEHLAKPINFGKLSEILKKYISK